MPIAANIIVLGMLNMPAICNRLLDMSASAYTHCALHLQKWSSHASVANTNAWKKSMKYSTGMKNTLADACASAWRFHRQWSTWTSSNCAWDRELAFIYNLVWCIPTTAGWKGCKTERGNAKPLHTNIFNNFLIRKCHEHDTQQQRAHCTHSRWLCAYGFFWRRVAVKTRHGLAFNTSSFSALLLMNT